MESEETNELDENVKKFNFNVSVKVYHKDRFMKMDVLVLDCINVMDANNKAKAFIKENLCKGEYAGYGVQVIRTLKSNINIVIS